MKLEKLIKQTNNKFLNMYQAVYGGKTPVNYFFATRREGDNVQNIKVCDAVKVLPYIPETNEIVFIKNFRYAVNNFVYELPAGLVDGNEDLVTCAKRELMEEIGAEVVSITEASHVGLSSAGMTDETLKLFIANVKLTGTQHLDESELIDIVKVKVDSLENFFNTHPSDVISELMVRLFLAQNNLV